MIVRALRMLAIVWVAAIAARYLDTVRKSLRDPINSGKDLQWMALVLALVALIAVSLAWNRAKAFRIWTAILGSTAIAILLLSGSLVPALMTLWVMTAATLLGDRLLVKLGLDSRDNLCERFVIAFPIGIAAFATFTFALALLRLFNSTIVWSAFLILTLVELRPALRLARHFRTRVRGGEKFFAVVPEAPFLILLMAFAAVRNLTWSVVPEVEFDALNMRLSVPKMFLAAGRFVDFPDIWHSYFVHLLEYVHGFCMALHGEAIAKLVVFVIGIAAAASVYSLGRLVFSPAVGLWAAAFFYTTPLVSWGTGTAYNDNAVAQFVTASLVAFLLWYRSQISGWIIVSGLLAGGAIAIKLNAVYAVIPLGIALLVIVGSRRIPAGRRFRTVASFAIVVFLVAAPWYLVVYILTGNPVFPLMNGIFRSPFWPLNNTLMNAAEFGIGNSPAALLRLPFRVTFDTIRFGEVLPRGSLGPLLLILIPLGLFKLRENREARIVTLVVIVYLVLWGYTFQYGRYYTAIIPGLAIVALGGFLLSAPGFYERSRRVVLAALLVAQIVLLPLLYWRIPERFPLDFAFGREDRESFLRSKLGGYGAAKYLNASVQPGEKVLAVGFEHLRFYMKPPLMTYIEARRPGVLSRAMQLKPGEELSRILLEGNIAYVLVHPQDLLVSGPYYPYASPEFLNTYATLEYSDSETKVYRLKR
jgi:Dolichyl-phosphate-mannose-protein mannosyltransferase